MGTPKKKYSGEYKQQVVEKMRNEKMGYRETARLVDVPDHKDIARWERIYLEEGWKGLYIERRGRSNGHGKGCPPKLDEQIERDLIAENQYLRAENEYLKNLNALVKKREQREKKRR